MNRDDFLTFNPRPDDPLVVAFIEFAREKGFSSSINFGFWDFLVSDHSDEPQLALKTVKNGITESVLARLVVDPTPMKIVLVEGQNPMLERLEGLKIFLAQTATGLYVRGLGWLALPGSPLSGEIKDIQLKLSKRWSQDEDGVWVKACTRCGEIKPREGFYRSSYPHAKDPYRNWCKPCFVPQKEDL